LGIAFLAIGISGPRNNFVGIGAAFLAIGVALWVRERRTRAPK